MGLLHRADLLGCPTGLGWGSQHPAGGGQAGGWVGVRVFLALLDCPADISSVVLFGACIEGVVLRDK